MNKNSKTLKRTLFTISGITGISVLSTLFVIPNQACVNSSVNDSESKIINFSNNSLINLKSEIDNYLLSNKYSFDELDNKLTHDYKFLDQFKQLLVRLSNNLISLESIGEIKLSLRNGIIYLVIKSSDSYKYKTTNSNNFLDELNSCIIFSNLKCANNISFNEISFSNFENKLLNRINSYRYTINSFKSFIISNDFKTFIFENLKDNKNNVVSSNSIGICSFNEQTKLLTINSSKDYKFTIYQDNNPIFTSTISISLSNINFYLDRPLLNLNSLHEILDNEIKNNKYTKSDFAYYFNLNNEYYKNLIAKNLYTINNQKIDESEVESVSLDNGNLIVSLSPPINESYSIKDSDNFSLNINNLIIKNLPYLKSITLSNLSILKKAIQQEIDINKFDIEQFQSYLKNNEESVKLLISNNLYISDTNKIDIDQISSVSYDGENINIELIPPKDTKYSLESNNYASLENNILTIYLIRIYKDFQLSNLSNLVQEIQKKIINEKFTIDDLKEYIKTENGWMKQLISNNLYISNESSGVSSPISINRISNIILSNNDIEIQLNTDNNNKYSLKEENLDISLLDNSKLIVKNLKYFIATKLFGLSELYNSIKEIIISNNYTLDSFSGYVNTNKQYLKSLIVSKLSTSNNKQLDELSISDIKFSNDNLLITFVSSENHKYTIEENPNAIIENDVLQISNLF